MRAVLPLIVFTNKFILLVHWVLVHCHVLLNLCLLFLGAFADYAHYQCDERNNKEENPDGGRHKNSSC